MRYDYIEAKSFRALQTRFGINLISTLSKKIPDIPVVIFKPIELQINVAKKSEIPSSGRKLSARSADSVEASSFC